jgi:hypothetical protein
LGWQDGNFYTHLGLTCSEQRIIFFGYDPLEGTVLMTTKQNDKQTVLKHEADACEIRNATKWLCALPFVNASTLLNYDWGGKEFIKDVNKKHNSPERSLKLHDRHE